jgi:tetratricopeptide (TPR) repeat protein
MTPRALALTALLLTAALAAPARADDEAAKNEARALLQGGNKLLEKGDLNGALALFESAYAKYPSPLILINIGTTQRDLDRPAEAANAYARFIAAPGEFTDRVPKIKRLLAELDRSLGSITFTIEPADAEIAIADGPFVSATLLARWRVRPANVVIRARKDGFDPSEQTVTVKKGKTVAVSISLRETPLAPPTPPSPTPDPDTIDGDDTSASLHARIAPRPPRLGVTARALIDGRGRGAAMSAGALVRVHDRVELVANAIFAYPDELTVGAYAAAHVELGSGAWRPRLVAGVPVMFDDGAKVSARAAVGIGWYASPQFAVVLEVGGEYGFNPPDDIDTWQLTPTLGAEAHL